MRTYFLALALTLFACGTAVAAEEILHEVPASIDSTGKTEVSTPLMKWLASLPAATKEKPATVRFAKDGTYWVDYTIILRRGTGSGSIQGVMWRDLNEFALDHYRLDLNGATIEQRTRDPFRKADGTIVDPRKRWGNPIVMTYGATDVQIYNGTLRGSCNAPTYKPNFEEWTGIRITGDRERNMAEDIVVRDLTVEHVHGDFVYLASATTAGGVLRNVRIENNTFRVAGRQGIVLNGGTNVLIKGNNFTSTSRFLFDSEPTRSSGWSDVRIEGNTGESGKLGYFQFSGPKLVIAEKLSIVNNTLSRGHFKIRLYNGNPETRRPGFTFTGNKVTGEAAKGYGSEEGRKPGALIEVIRWRDLTITDNHEEFSLVDGKPFHHALRLVDVEAAIVRNNTWKDAADAEKLAATPPPATTPAPSPAAPGPAPSPAPAPAPAPPK